MLYLLDANVLIRAHQDYYPFGRVEGFWDWIRGQGEAGAVKMSFEIHQEVAAGTDELATWIRQPQVFGALCLNEEVDADTLQRVLDSGYGPDLSEDELEEAGRDPFLVAYALMSNRPRTVVTKEVAKPSKRRGQTKLPDARDRLSVPWMMDFELYRRLDFRLS